MWTGLKCVRIRRVGRFCENGNEPSDSMRSAEICFLLRDWKLLPEDCDPQIVFWLLFLLEVVFQSGVLQRKELCTHSATLSSSVPTQSLYPASTGYSFTDLKRPDTEADSSFPSSKAAVKSIASPLPPYASTMLQLLREHLELSTFPILALCWRHF